MQSHGALAEPLVACVQDSGKWREVNARLSAREFDVDVLVVVKVCCWLGCLLLGGRAGI